LESSLLLPTTTTPWEAGDDPRGIDWIQSVLTYGKLAAALPLRRDYEADEGGSDPRDVPAMEIYLDTSGSMPNPIIQTNAMTLAAQILTASTLRKGGRVRGCVFSAGTPLTSSWMYNENTARDFFLNHSGGGTDYPFQLLNRWTDDTPKAIRVIISDGDFLWNTRLPEDGGQLNILMSTTNRSLALVTMLHLTEYHASPEQLALLQPLHALPGYRLVVVDKLTDFAGSATRLARALLGDP
jgi:hypothetical protein